MKRLVVFALLLTLVSAACSPSNTNDSIEYRIDGVVAVTDISTNSWIANETAEARYSAFRQIGVNCDGLADGSYREQCQEDAFQVIRQIVASVPCVQGIGGKYGSLYRSAQVVVSDGSGNVVGLGELTGGHAAYVPIVPRSTSIGIGRIYAATCIFDFRVEQLPASDFYSIEIPGQNPVALRFTDLEARNWEAEILYGFNSDVVIGPVDAPPPTTPPASTP